MTVEDAAAYLQMHPETVREKLRSQELPGRKVGRAWRLLKTELDAYLRGEFNRDTE
jgi:excisionase family DNA binding protein